jgi:GTPase SAR1 family protein
LEKSRISNSESFDNLKEWISSIKKNMESKDIFIPVIIIGNKIDMKDSRETSKEDAEKFAKENNYKYFETSAKTGEGVDDAIRELVIQILKQNGQIDDQKEARASSVQIKEENLDKKSEKKKGCC